MKYGQVHGIQQPIARMVMGTMIYDPDNMDRCRTMLDYYVSLGGNCLDTARVYGGGKSERAVGNWIRERGNRKEIVLIGKGAHHDATGPRVNPDAIATDIGITLDLLQTDYIDLYLLHRDDPGVPVGPIVECLNEHQRSGRIRAFGGSNWTTSRLQAANDYADAHGLQRFAASSPNFSLAVPNVPRWAGCVSVHTEDRAWHKNHNFPLFSWSSQAGGFFTGRFSPDNQDDAEMVRVWYSGDNFERLRRVNELAGKKNATPIQIAFAYVICQPFPTFALVGPRSNEETASSVSGFDVTLTQEEVEWLNLERG